MRIWPLYTSVMGFCFRILSFSKTNTTLLFYKSTLQYGNLCYVTLRYVMWSEAVNCRNAWCCRKLPSVACSSSNCHSAHHFREAAAFCWCKQRVVCSWADFAAFCGHISPKILNWERGSVKVTCSFVVYTKYVNLTPNLIVRLVLLFWKLPNP
jgi:hypothetical protein